jgi:hypothetical protein
MDVYETASSPAPQHTTNRMMRERHANLKGLDDKSLRLDRRLIYGASVLVLLGGCTATIVRSPKDGGPIDGKIVGNSATKVYVLTPSGEEIGVPRAEIQEVDHPGNVIAIVGALLTVYGLYNISVGLPKCDEKGTAFCAGVLAPTVVGLPLMIGGLSVYVGSVSAAKGSAPSGLEARLYIVPVGGSEGQLARGAAVGIGGRF